MGGAWFYSYTVLLSIIKNFLLFSHGVIKYPSKLNQTQGRIGDNK